MDTLLRSAATVAAFQLFVLKRSPDEINGQQLAFDSGTATITLSDDSGKVDLNSAGPDLLAAAYRASGLKGMPPATFAARVIDWRDGDLTLSEEGAEVEAYQSVGRSKPRDGAFRTTSDLLWVIGLGERDMVFLEPFVTLYNPTGRLNPYSTSPQLLEGMTGISVKNGSVLRALLALPRTEASDEKVAGFLTEHSALLDFNMPSVARISVSAQLTDSHVTRRVDLVASASTSGKTPFRVLNWKD